MDERVTGMDSEHRSHKHVLCVGAAVLDTLFRVHDMPKGEGKVLPYEMLQIAEGMASSAAYAVHRMGGRASLWGAVGDDETGIEGRVELVEGTGSEIYAKLSCKGDDIACLFRERLDVRFGDTIHIAIDPAMVHLFDKDSGKRI